MSDGVTTPDPVGAQRPGLDLEALMRNLGRASKLDELAQLLEPHGIAMDTLRQQHGGEPYCVSLASHGLDLALQCLNPDQPDDQKRWGLHRLTLHGAASNPARYWSQPWPFGLDAQQARAADVVRQLAANPEEAMNTPTLVCFAIERPDGLTWALLATFDPGSLKLQTLSLQRSGEWVLALAEPAPPVGALA